MHLAVRKRTAMPFAYSKLSMTDDVAFNPNALVEHAIYGSSYMAKIAGILLIIYVM